MTGKDQRAGKQYQSTDSPSGAALRGEVRGWLDAHWDPEMDPADWRKAAVDSGWAYCTWPTEYYGRGIAPDLAHIIEEEFEKMGAPSPSFGPSFDRWAFFMGHAMLEHASQEMKRDQLPKLLRGELGEGCLFYSEPGAGSDLAAIQTRADRDGAGYVINGQKVWSSLVASADWGLLVARTNWDVPKHRGLSFFLFPLRVGGVLAPGIDIRPIKQMTGEMRFNEVFFTDARVPAENLVGQENDGWRVLMTALAYERVFMSRPTPESGTVASSSVLHGASDFVEAARRAGKDTDPVIRDMIAQIHTWRLAQNWTGHRADQELRAGGSSWLASLGKLSNSRVLHATATLLRLLDGPAALLYDYDDLDKTSPNFRAMSAFVNSIGGGSDQIQRNIIGERVLGLPKTPEPDRDVPFREARKSAAVRRFG